jgi:hypothetical protein
MEGLIMSDRFKGTITILSKDYDRPEIKELLERENFDTKEVCGDMIELTNSSACYGKFEELEWNLIERGIPFDRFSEGFFEYLPEVRQYRPARDGRDQIDQLVRLSNGEETYIELKDIKEILEQDIPHYQKISLVVKKIKEEDYCEFPLGNENDELAVSETKLVEITPDELAKMVLQQPLEKDIDFAENTSDGGTGWHCIKRTKIFDEEGAGLIAIGYQGGGSTRVLDLTYDYEEKEVVNFISTYVWDVIFMKAYANDVDVDCRNTVFVEVKEIKEQEGKKNE